MRMHSKVLFFLLLFWQYAWPSKSLSPTRVDSKIPKEAAGASQLDHDSELQYAFSERFVLEHPRQPSSLDRFFADHDPRKLMDALVHVHSARNASAMRELREITGSKFSEYVSHNTFAIIAPAGVLAECAFYAHPILNRVTVV